jgi:predicted AlkP superfamily pyrophosphatase or phosphodiesterase
MAKIWRRLASCVTALALTALTALPAASPAESPTPPKPTLIVTLVIDQFAAALFERYRPGFTGGMARLAGGIAFPDGYQSHAATETCPGHSTILTGMHPSETGIVANTWFDVKTGSSIYCVAVRDTADPAARGPQNLRVDTLGDWLKAQSPASQVVSISGKDRAAIMLGGHHADAVYWWTDGVGFATSSYAGPADDAVTAPAKVFDNALFQRWRSAPPALWPMTLRPACRALVKAHKFGDITVSGAVPPDQAQGVESGDAFLARNDFQDQLRTSPIFDPLALDFAVELIGQRHLGQGPAPDLLAISLSSTDYIGHRYGNGGAEMCVQMAALDQAIGAFLAKLDALGVPYVVALSADHGAIDAAERAAEHGIAAKRIDGAVLVAGLNAHLRKTLGVGYDPIVGDDPQQLSINIPPSDPAFRAKLQAEAIDWLKQQPQVSHVFTAQEVAAAAPKPGTSPDKLSLPERFHESYDSERSGDIIVALSEYATVGRPRAVGDTVAGHGSPWDYDRRVPILFWWKGVAAQNHPEPIETVDIAPTLAAVAGIATPKVDGRCLAAVAGRCPAARRPISD